MCFLNKFSSGTMGEMFLHHPQSPRAAGTEEGATELTWHLRPYKCCHRHPEQDWVWYWKAFRMTLSKEEKPCVARETRPCVKVQVHALHWESCHRSAHTHKEKRESGKTTMAFMCQGQRKTLQHGKVQKKRTKKPPPFSLQADSCFLPTSQEEKATRF